MRAGTFWIDDYREERCASQLISNPTLRILVFTLFIILSFFFRSASALSVELLLVLAFSLGSGLGLHRLQVAARKISVFIVLVMLLNLLFARGSETGLFPKRAVYAGAINSLRILVLYFSALSFTVLSTPEEIARGLASFASPFSSSLARRMALYGFIAFGFLPIFSHEIERIGVMQRFRGGGIEGGFLKKLRGTPSLLVPLLVSAIRRSSQLALAVEVRRLKSAVGILLSNGRPAPKDYVWLGVIICLLILTLVFLG